MKIKKITLWLSFFLLFGLFFYLSLSLGAARISQKEIFQALFAFQPSNQTQQILRNIRLPRILAGFFVGSSFAVSGALMQGVTRNPLADSGLLGINGGASLGLVCAFILFPHGGSNLYALFSFGGAFLATGLLFLLLRYSSIGFSPVALVLAGVAIGSFFAGISQALALFFNLNQDLAFWFVGGVANITWPQFFGVLPFYLCGVLASLLFGKQLNLLAFGDDTVVSLGKNPLLIRGGVMLIVVFLAGLSVSLVGPVSFIGLLVPHVMRFFVGENYRLLLPASIVAGGLLVMVADLIARLINPPFETPFGIIITLIGVPFLLYKVRREA